MPTKTQKTKENEMAKLLSFVPAQRSTSEVASVRRLRLLYCGRPLMSAEGERNCAGSNSTYEKFPLRNKLTR